MKRSIAAVLRGFVLGTGCLAALAACGLPANLRWSPSDTPPPTPPTITIHTIVDQTPTPVDPPYKVAAWAADDLPVTQVTLYARFTHFGEPVPGAVIRFVIHYPGHDVSLTAETNSDGMASVVTAAGSGPVVVDVYATYEDIQSHNTAFFMGGIVPPTPTSAASPTPAPTSPPGPIVTPQQTPATGP